MAHADQERRELHRRLRTLCEDLDELLGQVGDAVRRDRAPEGARLLGHAMVIATELAERLAPGASGRRSSTLRVVASVLDEVDVQRTNVLLEELDAELDHTARGRGGRRAAALADGLVSEITDLAGAAASGRARARTGPFPARSIERGRQSMSASATARHRWDRTSETHAVNRQVMPYCCGEVMTSQSIIDGRLYRAVNYLNNVDGDGVRYEDAGVSDADVERLRIEVARLRGELAEALGGTSRVLTS